MNITCLQENLKRGLAIVSHAVAGKSTLPVLSNVLLACDGGRLKLAATNLEIGITHWLGAQVAQEGAVTVPARLLADVVGSLPNEPVTMELEPRSQTLKLTCGRFTTNVKGIEADEFPAIPVPQELEPAMVLPAPVLVELLDQVVFAAADTDTRPVIAGVLIRLCGAELFLAAADGFRMATRRFALPAPAGQNVEIIPLARALSELARVMAGIPGDVRMTVSPGANQILFRTDTTELVSRLIDGKYPNTERIIPAQYLTRAVLDVKELLKAVRLASYFASASQNVLKLTLTPGDSLAPGRLVISANAAEVGDNTGELECVVMGQGGTIALNVKYLAAMLGAITTAQVAIEIQSPQSPGVFKPVGQDGNVQIIMPMSER